MNTALEIAPQVGIGAACVGLGVARATFYRVQRPVSAPAPRPASPGTERTEAAHDPRVAARPGVRRSQPPHRVRHAAGCEPLPRGGLAPSYHGAAGCTEAGMLVHTEFGADAWTMVLKAVFATCKLVPYRFPSGLAIVGKKSDGDTR